MKKQLALVAALACSGAYAVDYVTGTQFTNLDFSDGTNGWGYFTDGGTFTVSAAGGKGILTKTGDLGWSTGMLYQCVPVTAGEKVVLTGGQWSGTMPTGTDLPDGPGYWASVVFYTIPDPSASANPSGAVMWGDPSPVPTNKDNFSAAVDYPGNIEFMQTYTNSGVGNNNAVGNTLTSGHDVAGVADFLNPLGLAWTDAEILTSSPYNYLAVKTAMGAGWNDDQRVNYDSINTLTSLGWVVIGLKYGTAPGYDNYGSVSFGGLQIVPEPASLGLLALGAMAFLGRRRK